MNITTPPKPASAESAAPRLTELARFVGRRAGLDRRLGLRSCVAAHEAHDHARVDSEVPRREHRDEAADAELRDATAAAGAHAAVILDVLALTTLAPTHAADVSKAVAYHSAG